MKKLFEIPVSALSPSKLNIRTSNRISELMKFLAHSDPDEAALVIDREKQCFDR